MISFVSRLHDLMIGRDGRQMLTVATNIDLREQFDEMKDKLVKVEIKEYREKRSLDANAYCWVLIDKLAEAVGIPPKEVYREAIRNIGGVSDIVCVKEKSANALCTAWEGRGIGWQTERFESKIQGCVNVKLWYGSSEYDTAQMARLIDGLIEDCKEYGIETMTPREIDTMLEKWEER